MRGGGCLLILNLSDHFSGSRRRASSLRNDTFPTEISVKEPSCIVINGQAAVMLFGKPSTANTFGDYADEFVKFIFQQGKACHRIDVAFDWYRDLSIKVGSRMKFTKKSRPVWRLIEHRDIPLPNEWPYLLGSNEKKAELAHLLLNALIAAAPQDKWSLLVGACFWNLSQEFRPCNGHQVARE